MPHDVITRTQAYGDLTIADVIALLQADAGLDKRHRQDFCSALRTLCRAMGKVPSEVVADPGALRRGMREIAPLAVGLNPGRWRNASSLSMTALRSAGLTVRAGRPSVPLSPVWRRLLDLLPDRHSRHGLSRFMAYCDEQGITPETVDDRVMDGFALMIQRDGVCKRPKAVHRTATQVWNRAADELPSWPRTMLTIPNYRRAVALPNNEFPPSFLAERDAYLRALEGPTDRLAAGDRLARLGKRRRRPTTIRNRRIHLMQLASALVRRGHSIADISLKYVVVHAEDALRFFLARLPEGETSGQVHQLSITLKTIGRHLRVPPEELDRLSSYCSGLAPDDSGMSDRKRARLQQFDNPDHLIKLLRTPRRVARELTGKKGTPTPADASIFMKALAIELLIVKPMRMDTLAKLDIDLHIKKLGSGRDARTQISVPAANVKNGLGFDALLPHESAAMLDLYRRNYRPLLGGDPRHLFPSQDGGRKKPGAFGAALTTFIKDRSGLTVNPHLMRSIAAIIILNRNPGAYEDVRLVLGNKDTAIIVKHYCGEEYKAALRRYDEMVLEIRGEPEDPKDDSPEPPEDE